MSDTPISDSTPHNVADLGMQIRRIERKLNAANDRINRLEEAGDNLHFGWIDGYMTQRRLDEWLKAKEAKL